jgi:glucose-6-phosphate isomerase
MLKEKNFFKKLPFDKKKLKKNILKTKQEFDTLYSEFKNCDSPLLESYKKDYKLNFSISNLKKLSKYENIIIFGMGGSILGTKSIYSFLKKKIKKKIFFFDNLDENQHAEFKKIKNLKNSCFVVVSKSGNTLETIVNLCLIFSKSLIKNNLFVITELKDSNLIHVAKKFNAEIIEHKNFIGGRYSVLSEVGMLPAALMGLDINKFRNISKLIENKFFVKSLIKNVACLYSLNQKNIKNSVILSYDSDLNDLGYWYQQLTAESLGKKGRGITPILSSAPRDHHSMLQLYLDGPKDKIYTFFTPSKNSVNGNKIFNTHFLKNMSFLKNKNIQSILKAQSEAVMRIFKLKKIPFRHFEFNKKSEAELGEFFTFFVLETILLGRLLNINAFDQPAVEQIKIETKKILLV